MDDLMKLQLKNEIITSLDVLPIENLEFLAKLVTFLKGQATEFLPSSTLTSIPAQNDNPFIQLGKNPIDDDIMDASINHNWYIYET